MANNKLTKSLRNSIAAETKSVDLLHGLDATPQNKQAKSTSTAKPKANVAQVTKKSAIAKPAAAKVVAAKTPAKKSVLSKKPVSKAANTQNKQLAAKPKAKASVKAAVKKPNNASSSAKTNSFARLQDNLMAGIAHTKLHHLVETNYHLCETCLENLQKVNDNLHDYLNQLVEINNVNSLIKLNLSYLSAAPTRYQEMIAQNKNIFSNFFKFARPNE